jgi:hypothetical protein
MSVRFAVGIGRAAAWIALIGATALAGCGSRSAARYTPAAYEAVLQQWTGRSETDLINTWGVPDRSQLLSGGGQVLEYDRREKDKITCATLFTSNLTGTIERWTYSGTDCRPLRIDAAQR